MERALKRLRVIIIAIPGFRLALNWSRRGIQGRPCVSIKATGIIILLACIINMGMKAPKLRLLWTVYIPHSRSASSEQLEVSLSCNLVVARLMLRWLGCLRHRETSKCGGEWNAECNVNR